MTSDYRPAGVWWSLPPSREERKPPFTLHLTYVSVWNRTWLPSPVKNKKLPMWRAMQPASHRRHSWRLSPAICRPVRNVSCGRRRPLAVVLEPTFDPPPSRGHSQRHRTGSLAESEGTAEETHMIPESRITPGNEMFEAGVFLGLVLMHLLDGRRGNPV